MNELDQRLQTIEAKAVRQRRLIVFAAALAFVVNAVFFWFVLQPHTVPPLVNVVDLQAVGPVSLCAGDVLSYRYTLQARVAAIIEVSTTTLRTGPEVVHYGGMVVREAFPEALSLVRNEVWGIPPDAPPGSYVRLVAVTTPGRVTQPAFGTLAFKVEECK